MIKTPAQFVVGDLVVFEGQEKIVADVRRATTWGKKGTRTIVRLDGTTYEMEELDFDNPMPDDAFEVSWKFVPVSGFYGVQAFDHISYIKDDREFEVVEPA